MIEPTGVVMEQELGTGIRHAQGFASVGFKGRPYITPDTVSFANIQVREGLAFGVGVGYYFFLNGVGHPNGPWAEVDSGTVTHPSKVQVLDEIYTGTGPPPFGNGSVTWPIPWLFKVDIVSGLEKEFAPVTHFQEANTLGTAFISKGGVSRSRAATDPTTEW